jgi:hypothetical protein
LDRVGQRRDGEGGHERRDLIVKLWIDGFLTCLVSNVKHKTVRGLTMEGSLGSQVVSGQGSLGVMDLGDGRLNLIEPPLFDGDTWSSSRKWGDSRRSCRASGSQHAGHWSRVRQRNVGRGTVANSKWSNLMDEEWAIRCGPGMTSFQSGCRSWNRQTQMISHSPGQILVMILDSVGRGRLFTVGTGLAEVVEWNKVWPP